MDKAQLAVQTVIDKRLHQIDHDNILGLLGERAHDIYAAILPVVTIKVGQ